VDLDAFAAAHRDQWERLDVLVSRRHLSGGEADEEGIVTFEASWRDGATGRTGAQRERSRFERRRGLWVYVSGTDR